jgi:hypothetical protein
MTKPVRDVAPLDLGLPPGELPMELASFVGREHEIEEVAHRLQGTRLLTLIGVGGIARRDSPSKSPSDVVRTSRTARGL